MKEAYYADRSIYSSLYNLSFDEALDKAVATGVSAVEIGAGGYPGGPHCPVDELLESESKCEEYLEDAGLPVGSEGDSCVDLIMTGDDVTPRFGQVEKLVDDYVVEMGGSCLIFAWQAARLGLRVGILGRVGDDDFGRLVLRRLDEYGVDTSRMIVDPSLKTGLGIALCPPDDRAVLTHLGSLPEMRPDDVTDEFLASARQLFPAHAPSATRARHLPAGKRAGLHHIPRPQLGSRRTVELDVGTGFLAGCAVYLRASA